METNIENNSLDEPTRERIAAFTQCVKLLQNIEEKDRVPTIRAIAIFFGIEV